MPRRYPNYPPDMQFLNIMSTAGYTVQLAGFLLIAVYLVLSLSVTFGMRLLERGAGRGVASGRVI